MTGESRESIAEPSMLPPSCCLYKLIRLCAPNVPMKSPIARDFDNPALINVIDPGNFIPRTLTYGLHTGVKATLHPFSFFAVSWTCPVHGCGSRLSIWPNSCSILTTTYEASVVAFSRPAQPRGPPPKGKNSQVFGLNVSHRSGSNLSASGPYMDCSRCRT